VAQSAGALLANYCYPSVLGQQHVGQRRGMNVGYCGKWVGSGSTRSRSRWPQMKRIVAQPLATFVATLTGTWSSITIIITITRKRIKCQMFAA